MILFGRKRFLVRLRQDEVQHTHKGLIPHADIIGQPSGTRLATHLGDHYVALLPSLHDIIMSIQRISQIVYPKEIGYILLKLNVGAGSRVIECGTGSGAMTIALAHAVRPEGRVYTYERRADMMRVAAKNLANAGLEDWVDLKERVRLYMDHQRDGCILGVIGGAGIGNEDSIIVGPGRQAGQIKADRNNAVAGAAGGVDRKPAGGF